jgi:3-deoxy-D-manno-octulosonic-acid transferase
MEIVKPQKVFFVKYEFWFNYLKELKNNNIPTYLVSGIFREDHYFFRFSGAWFRKQLSSFTHFFLQDKKSVELLNSICFNNATLCGDTRFDRVLEISKNAKQIELVKQFVSDKKIMILGSSWAEDEKIVASCFLKNQQLKTNYKIIIAPHEIDENHISSIEALFISEFSCLRYSNASDLNIKDAQLLIVDNVGMLSSLYQYGTIAFIGGGFGKGIHNILEAATFGLPVIFGPNYQKFTEAKELIKLGGAFSVNDILEFEKTLILLSDEQVLKTASVISKMYVQGRVGATEKILDAVFPK